MGHLEVHAHLKIRPGELEGFKLQAAEIMRLTREQDTQTIRYDWFINEDGTECEVHEAYLSGQGLIEHNAHVMVVGGPLPEVRLRPPHGRLWRGLPGAQGAREQARRRNHRVLVPAGSRSRGGCLGDEERTGRQGPTRLLERLTTSELVRLLWVDYGRFTDVGRLAVLGGAPVPDEEGNAIDPARRPHQRGPSAKQRSEESDEGFGEVGRV